MKKLLLFVTLLVNLIHVQAQFELSSEVYFDTDKHKLRKDARATIDTINQFILDTPPDSIFLWGHTDNRASVAYNQALSERRVESVFQSIKGNIASEEIIRKVIGFSELKPVEKNDTPEHMQRNRRVEIILFYFNKENNYSSLDIINSSNNVITNSSSNLELTTNKISHEDSLYAQLQPKFTGKKSKYFDSTYYQEQVKTIIPKKAKTLVVMDWTRSMYPYGTGVINWHINNIDTSSIEYLTFFNDGDQKKQDQKKLGATYGVYHSKASEIDQVFSLMDKVSKKGTGGDFPENYIEAIDRAETHFPDADTVVLIADNRACIRDFVLIENLDKPVKVLLPGIKRENATINYQYLQLAAITGGSVQILDNEITDLSLKDGQIKPTYLTDTIIKMPKVKGNLKKVERERKKYAKRHEKYSIPPITIVEGEEYQLLKKTKVVNDSISYNVGYPKCHQYDFEIRNHITVKPTFTVGQHMRKCGRVAIGICLIPVRIVVAPFALIFGEKIKIIEPKSQ